jgi:hypothetical protein
MCSTAAQRIAEIGLAIDDLAVKAGPAHAVPAGHAGPGPNAQAAIDDTDPIVTRLAELWVLLAELDPEVARRLPGYQNLSALADLCPTRHLGHPHSSAGHLTDGRDWPSGRQIGPSLRPLSAGTARPRLSCRRSRLRAWHLPRGATAPRPGAPPQS